MNCHLRLRFHQWRFWHADGYVAVEMCLRCQATREWDSLEYAKHTLSRELQVALRALNTEKEKIA